MQSAAAEACPSVFRDNSRLRQKLAEKVEIPRAYATAHLALFYFRHTSDKSHRLGLRRNLTSHDYTQSCRCPRATLQSVNGRQDG